LKPILTRLEALDKGRTASLPPIASLSLELLTVRLEQVANVLAGLPLMAPYNIKAAPVAPAATLAPVTTSIPTKSAPISPAPVSPAPVSPVPTPEATQAKSVQTTKPVVTTKQETKTAPTAAKTAPAAAPAPTPSAVKQGSATTPATTAKPAAAAPAAAEKPLPKKEDIKKFYTLDELKKPIDGIDNSVKEMWLSDTDFNKLMGMTKDEWAKAPGWKRQQKKKAVGLF